jgi:3-phosphoshikimate 1-carboxyvinyltransferase
MPLPSLIEIVPLNAPVTAEITVPGSKSITNRALVLAALADGTTTLRGALWSEDTQVMVECLTHLGFAVKVEPDPSEDCNRTITVKGLGGAIPRAGTPEKPLELFVGNAGTAARFLAAMVCLGGGVYRLSGIPRMHERPQAALFHALRELGYRIDATNDKLPAVIHGQGTRKAEDGARKCTVSVDESSQFASALILSAGVGGWDITISGGDDEELPYVEMTKELVKAFPMNGGEFQIEPDASSGSYFMGAGWLLMLIEQKAFMAATTRESDPEAQKAIFEKFAKEGRTRMTVADWPNSGWQLDADFTTFAMRHTQYLVAEISRVHDLADSIMTTIVLAPFTASCVRFTDLGRLRVQECERVIALRTELTKCGAKVVEEGDTLTVHPSELHGAEIETYNDHRMAMCFAVLGLKVPGIKIRNPSCVKKTFPNFFQKLAAAPPHGLGATILDGTGRPLSGAALFAD